MCKILKKVSKQWKKNWPDYTIQLIFLIIFGFLLTLLIGKILKPQTDIELSCKISNSLNDDYNLEITFYNNADFAGKNFYVYIWRLDSGSWGTDYYVSEQCERIQKSEIDLKRFKIFCDFIPPNSNTMFSIDGKLDNYTIATNKIEIEWWGETTPHKKEFISCG